MPSSNKDCLGFSSSLVRVLVKATVTGLGPAAAAWRTVGTVCSGCAEQRIRLCYEYAMRAMHRF